MSVLRVPEDRNRSIEEIIRTSRVDMYQPPVKRLDPKDFMWMNRNGETLIREPGSVDGQQFIIDKYDPL
eukprot:3843963-Pyramimonas_sp.AAC.1